MGSLLMCKAIRAILYVLRRTESEAHHTFISSTKFKVGWGSVVGIATGYGLDVWGSNPGEGETFRACPDQPWGPPSLLYNGYRVFPGVKSSRSVK